MRHLLKPNHFQSIAVFKWTSVVKPLSALAQQQARTLSRTACVAAPQHVDYYAVMHVSKTAKQREIQEAYKTLRKVFDPKKHPDNAGKLQQVEEAFAVLSNVATRRMFDQGILLFFLMTPSSLMIPSNSTIPSNLSDDSIKFVHFEPFWRQKMTFSVEFCRLNQVWEHSSQRTASPKTIA